MQSPRDRQMIVRTACRRRYRHCCMLDNNQPARPPCIHDCRSYSRSSSAVRPPALGRATSSKKCIIVACAAAALTIALGVGLGVGLSSGGDGTGSSDTAGGAGEPAASPSPAPSTFVPATLMTKSADGSYVPLMSLSDACQQLAEGEALAPPALVCFAGWQSAKSLPLPQRQHQQRQQRQRRRRLRPPGLARPVARLTAVSCPPLRRALPPGRQLLGDAAADGLLPQPDPHGGHVPALQGRQPPAL